jgi:hypothetical protein
MNIIPEDELWALPPLDTMAGERVVELGNKKNSNGLYRTQYESFGANYLCIDWNSQDGAIPIDMGQRIEDDNKLYGYADLVTNFGFTEHVYTDQVQCWENVARLSSKVGCYLAIVLPYPRHWEHHGVYQPTMDWLTEWHMKNNYAMHTCTVNDKRRRWVNVVGSQRMEPFNPDTYHTPSFEMMYITPPRHRVNPKERNCGIS